jgi:hypothetical protein
MRQNGFPDVLITLVITPLQPFERSVPDLDSSFAPAAESRRFLRHPVFALSQFDRSTAGPLFGVRHGSGERLIAIVMGKNRKPLLDLLG